MFLILVEYNYPFQSCSPVTLQALGAVKRLNLVLAVHIVYIRRSILDQLTGKTKWP